MATSKMAMSMMAFHFCKCVHAPLCFRIFIGPAAILEGNKDHFGQFRGDGRTVRTLVFGVYKICCITGSYLWVIQKDITL